MDKIKVKYETGFLFTKSNFLKGLGSVFNLPGNYYDFNTSETPDEADEKAIMSDWENVGADLRKAKQKFKNENNDLLCLK